MAFIGDCSLCLSKKVEIRSSHIIPELCYKQVYTKTHKFIPLTDNASKNMNFEQKGYREKLLCQGCETKLSVWEKEFGNFLNLLTTPGVTGLSLKEFDNVTIINNFNYDYIKKAIISIFWRMSISKIEFFSAYNLGPYNERFRMLLYNNTFISSTDFPILISKATLNGKFENGILMPITRGRYSNIIMQSVVLNSFVFDILLSENKRIPEEVRLCCLNDINNGRAIMIMKDFSELRIHLNKFVDSLKSSKIHNFFEKYN